MTETQARDATTLTESHLHNPAWYYALTLQERLTTLRAEGGNTAPTAPYDADVACRRLKKWKDQPAFHKNVSFTEYLSTHNLTEEEFCILLGESIETVKFRTMSPPAWLLTLLQAYEKFSSIEGYTLPSLEQKQESSPSTQLYMLMETVKPLVKQGLDRVQTGIYELMVRQAHVPFDRATILYVLYPNLVKRVLPQLTKVITLELNIARLRGQLTGNTAEERFSVFIQQLSHTDAMLDLLASYPVLARDLVEMIDIWVESTLEFLERLCADWQAICRTFHPPSETEEVVDIDVGAGDSHCQGRSVALLRFRSGFRLVYKPKPLAITEHFQELLQWMNARLEQTMFRTITVLNKGMYGWVEFISPEVCTAQEQVKRFYERQGGYLALLYALEATDFHFENLIAAGEHPVLIDIETLFHPRLKREANIGQGRENVPGIETLERSVLRPGLLPVRIRAMQGNPGIDVSGLGGKEGQMTAGERAILASIGTDEMHIVRQRIAITGRQNRPVLNGKPVDALGYSEHVVTGFSTIYRLLMAYRETFSTEVLPRFASDEIRLIIRPTFFYGRLLEECSHPQHLQDALIRERLYTYCWNEFGQRTYLDRVIALECADMRRGDIPYFSSYPGARDIYTSQRQCIKGFLAESGMELVKERFQQLSAGDLTRQVWFIRASFATAFMEQEQRSWKSSLLVPSATPMNRVRLLKQACAIGDRLRDLAIISDNDVNWVGLRFIGNREWAIAPAAFDLYSGTPGIILFLAYLGTISEESEYTKLARAACQSVQRYMEQAKDLSLPMPIGAFEGWGSILYLYAHLGAIWHEPAWWQQADELVESLAGKIEQDDAFDILAGAAGCIHSLLALYHLHPSPQTLQVAIRCGDHLLARAETMPQGIGWKTPLNKEQPLTGLSHGAAGIALSLLMLAHVSDEHRFRQAAIAAIAYERSVFSPQEQNWPDLRAINFRGSGSPASEQGQYFLVTWCHGAPGIGLARLASLSYIDDETIRQEIAIALKTTLTNGFGLNHSLCHGDLGSLEVLLTASQILPDPWYREQVNHLAAMILDSIDTYGYSTGVPLGVEVPGLMTGVSGIGYELLRLAEPEQIPSVLLLAPPHGMLA